MERHEVINKRIGGERRTVVDFLAKYVRPDKADGSYLASQTGKDDVFNDFVRT